MYTDNKQQDDLQVLGQALATTIELPPLQLDQKREQKIQQDRDRALAFDRKETELRAVRMKAEDSKLVPFSFRSLVATDNPELTAELDQMQEELIQAGATETEAGRARSFVLDLVVTSPAPLVSGSFAPIARVVVPPLQIVAPTPTAPILDQTASDPAPVPRPTHETQENRAIYQHAIAACQRQGRPAAEAKAIVNTALFGSQIDQGLSAEASMHAVYLNNAFLRLDDAGFAQHQSRVKFESIMLTHIVAIAKLMLPKKEEIDLRKGQLFPVVIPSCKPVPKYRDLRDEKTKSNNLAPTGQS